MSEENKVVEAEVVETKEETKEEKTEEKKENGFKKFFGKVKQNVNDSILESKKESNYDAEHAEFKAYTKDALLAKRISGEVSEGFLTCFGKVELPKGSVIIDKDNKAYYVTTTEKATVTSKVDGTTYECEGTKIGLDENVEEVNVIRADSRYFIFKGEDKK